MKQLWKDITWLWDSVNDSRYYQEEEVQFHYLVVSGLGNLDKDLRKKKFCMLCLETIINLFNIWHGFRSLGL